jgi:hypothetical protein
MYIPREEFHTYKNIDSSSVGKLLVVITHPEFEKFFSEIRIPVDDEKIVIPTTRDNRL